MSDGGGFLAIARILLGILVALAIPTAVAALGARLLHRLIFPDFFEVPLVKTVANWSGIALGLLLMYARFDTGYFDMHQLFVPESPWNLTLWQFLAERVNPLNYGFGRLAVYPAGLPGAGGFVVWLF